MRDSLEELPPKRTSLDEYNYEAVKKSLVPGSALENDFPIAEEINGPFNRPLA